MRAAAPAPPAGPPAVRSGSPGSAVRTSCARLCAREARRARRAPSSAVRTAERGGACPPPRRGPAGRPAGPRQAALPPRLAGGSPPSPASLPAPRPLPTPPRPADLPAGGGRGACGPTVPPPADSALRGGGGAAPACPPRAAPGQRQRGAAAIGRSPAAPPHWPGARRPAPRRAGPRASGGRGRRGWGVQPAARRRAKSQGRRLSPCSRARSV